MGYSFHFWSLYSASYIELQVCNSLFKFQIWILKQFWHCPKRPVLPRHIKVWVSFELFGVLGMYNFGRGFELYEVKKFVIIFQKENGNTSTLFIIFIVKSLQKEQNSTNLLLVWPPFCRNKSAITTKWFNSLDTNSKKFAASDTKHL